MALLSIHEKTWTKYVDVALPASALQSKARMNKVSWNKVPGTEFDVLSRKAHAETALSGSSFSQSDVTYDIPYPKLGAPILMIRSHVRQKDFASHACQDS